MWSKPSEAPAERSHAPERKGVRERNEEGRSGKHIIIKIDSWWQQSRKEASSNESLYYLRVNYCTDVLNLLENAVVNTWSLMFFWEISSQDFSSCYYSLLPCRYCLLLSRVGIAQFCSIAIGNRTGAQARVSHGVETPGMYVQVALIQHHVSKRSMWHIGIFLAIAAQHGLPCPVVCWVRGYMPLSFSCLFFSKST